MKTQAPALPPRLPDDVEELQALVRELVSQMGTMSAQLEYLKRRLFGRSSEKLDSPDQLLLALGELSPPPAEAPAPPPAPLEKPAAKKGHGRRPASKELPRQRVVHDVAEPLKTCSSCAATKVQIGEDVSEQYEYVPSSVFILEHVRPKYACPCCHEGVCQAEKPAQPIEKGSAGPGLLAHILVSKYCDHLTLYRLESILARHGLQVTRSTLCGWTMEVAALLAALVREMRRQVLCSHVIHCDETPLKVLDGKGRAAQAWIWVYVGDRDHPYTVYDYQRSRGRAGPKEWLEGFSGKFLQTDAYQAYNAIYAGGDVSHAGCNAHARRKFHEAKSTFPVEALHVLQEYRQLYAVEEEARDLSPEERLALRREKSAPIFARLKTWLEETERGVLPKSPLGEAVGYMRSQWESLVRYLEDGRLAIDNNAAERAIRPLAVGRKNWLFAGSDTGGEAIAVIYSVVESAKRAGVEPFTYLEDLLRRLPSHPQREIGELLPDRWRAAREAHPAAPNSTAAA